MLLLSGETMINSGLLMFNALQIFSLVDFIAVAVKATNGVLLESNDLNS
jgi:hypothetical protein